MKTHLRCFRITLYSVANPESTTCSSTIFGCGFCEVIPMNTGNEKKKSLHGAPNKGERVAQKPGKRENSTAAPTSNDALKQWFSIFVGSRPGKLFFL
jgi:hypothetical protein